MRGKNRKKSESGGMRRVEGTAQQNVKKRESDSHPGVVQTANFEINNRMEDSSTSSPDMPTNESKSTQIEENCTGDGSNRSTTENQSRTDTVSVQPSEISQFTSTESDVSQLPTHTLPSVECSPVGTHQTEEVDVTPTDQICNGSELELPTQTESAVRIAESLINQQDNSVQPISMISETIAEMNPTVPETPPQEIPQPPSLTPEQSKALKLKEEGNKHLQTGDVERAIESYTHGLEADSLNYVLYSNRSAAYTRLHQNQKALDDAEMCIQINPAFLKGHSRRAAALLSLNRPLEALRAADLGLSFSSPESGSTDILSDIRRRAQSQLLGQAVKGKWKGSVHPTMGGYEQIFEFGNEPNKMTIIVMDRPTPARYSLQPAQKIGVPLGLDITAIAETVQPFMPPPTVPYIYRLFYVDPETTERVEYRGETELPLCPETQTGSTGEAVENRDAEWDQQLQWEMEMCGPFMTMERPEKFEGSGFVLMKKCHKPEEPRCISPEIENMSFDEQLSKYFKEVLGLHTQTRLEEPSPMDDQMAAASKISSFMQYQSKVFEIGRRFPDPVTVIAEQLFASPEQLVTGFQSEIQSADLLARREKQIESLSQSCRELLEQARLHIERTGLCLLQFSVGSPDLQQGDTASDGSMPSNKRNADRRKESVDETAKKLLDGISEHETAPGCRSWVKENQSALIASAIVTLLAVGTFVLIRRNRT